MEYLIYMGFDPREKLAYDVARYSILGRTSAPKKTIVKPLELKSLKEKFKVLDRPIEKREGGQMWDPISDAPQSTEFAISRFAVPLLTKSGWAAFVDCDIACLADITKLFALADKKYAVMVVKHNHQPKETVHMDGMIQTTYPRKNWSSVVLWNCDHPSNKALTKEVLNTWPGRDLHAFKWLKDEEIGELPIEWNFLIGYNDMYHDVPHNISIAIAHFTNGGPWLPGWEKHAGDEIWIEALEYMKAKKGKLNIPAK